MARVIGNTLADKDLLARMRSIGLERSNQFRWKRAAEDTLAIFNEIAGK
jgi:hypothetical protein